MFQQRKHQQIIASCTFILNEVVLIHRTQWMVLKKMFLSNQWKDPLTFRCLDHMKKDTFPLLLIDLTIKTTLLLSIVIYIYIVSTVVYVVLWLYWQQIVSLSAIKNSYEMTECLNLGSLSSVIVINLISSFLHRGWKKQNCE